MYRATRSIVSTVGVILGISGFDHGIFEILQGIAPTGGMFINAIGPDPGHLPEFRIWRRTGDVPGFVCVRLFS
jgi:hypothetical protein